MALTTHFSSTMVTSSRFRRMASHNPVDLSLVKEGNVVAIIGDFNPLSVVTLLRLIDLGVVMSVPLTVETTHEHEYFFDSALVDAIIKDGVVTRRNHSKRHEVYLICLELNTMLV